MFVCIIFAALENVAAEALLLLVEIVSSAPLTAATASQLNVADAVRWNAHLKVQFAVILSWFCNIFTNLLGFDV